MPQEKKATNPDVSIAPIGQTTEFIGIRTGNLSPCHHLEKKFRSKPNCCFKWKTHFLIKINILLSSCLSSSNKNISETCCGPQSCLKHFIPGRFRNADQLQDGDERENFWHTSMYHKNFSLKNLFKNVVYYKRNATSTVKSKISLRAFSAVLVKSHYVRFLDWRQLCLLVLIQKYAVIFNKHPYWQS